MSLISGPLTTHVGKLELHAATKAGVPGPCTGSDFVCTSFQRSTKHKNPSPSCVGI